MIVYSFVEEAKGRSAIGCDIHCIHAQKCRKGIDASIDISGEASGVGGGFVKKLDESIRGICASEEAERFEKFGPIVVILRQCVVPCKSQRECAGQQRKGSLAYHI